MALILWLERMLWSGPLLWGLLGSHVYFTCKLRGVQRWTGRGICRSLRGGRSAQGVSSFGALATSLAAAIGTGNIIGVATAVALGGPGAVFWCWLTGVLGMATRYAETALTLRSRRRRPDGTLAGGPMYVLADRLGRPGLGTCFAVLGVLGAMGTGAMIQTNAIGGALREAVGVPPAFSGLLTAGLAGLVILGGVRSVSRVCERLVPAMAGGYILGCILVLWINRASLAGAVLLILRSALLPRAAGGGLAGGAILTAARYGTARGLFTNEAGMGTAPMAAAAAPCDSVSEEALVSMTGVFWDTVVICALTGLVLVSSMLEDPAAFAGAGPETMCALAFSRIPLGKWVLTGSLVIFAFATVVGWSWYGESCWDFLQDGRRTGLYRALYLAAALLGAFGSLEAVWSLGSVLAGCMTLPNLYSLWALRDEAASMLPEPTGPWHPQSAPSAK